MKTKLFVISLAICVIGCSKHKSAIDQNIAEYIKQHAHNPESYEAVSTTCIDTITILQKTRRAIELCEKYSYSNDQSGEDSIKVWKHEVDSLEKSPNPNSIFGYEFIHQFRARVPLGGMMMKQAVVETDKDLNIISLVELDNYQ